MDSTRSMTDPTPNQLYPHHQQAFLHSPPTSTPPNLYNHHVHQLYHHRSMSSLVPPPPLPPKPIVYPTINPNGYHASLSSPPPPPPPPSLPLPPLPPLPPPPQDEVIVTSPTEDSDELAMVLALSQSESAQKKLLDEQLMNQEEEDLARALAASMLPSENIFLPPSNPTNGTPESKKKALDAHRIQSSPSHTPLPSAPNDLPGVIPGGSSEESSDSSILHDTYVEFGRHDKWRIPDQPGKQQEEETPKIETQANVARGESPALSVSSLPYDAPPSSTKLVAVKRSSISSVSSLPYCSSQPPECSHMDDNPSQEVSLPTDLSSALVSPGSVLQFDDAAYARQLAAEEEEFVKQSLRNAGSQQDSVVDQAKPSSTSNGKQNAEWHPSQSGRAMSHEELYGRQHSYPQDGGASPSGTTVSTPVPTFNSMQSTRGPPPIAAYAFPAIGRAKSYQPVPENRDSSIQFAPVVYPTLGGRRGSAPDTQFETNHNFSTPSPRTDRPQLRLDMSQRSAAPDARRPLHPPTIATTSAATSTRKPLSSTGVLNVNHFVDRGLLRGVSIGFKSPMISTRLIQMQDQMPNIISLPYTRCPPLHLQAPDWRHLLRLMARLSGTRMEPTVEAMAVSKTELKLRTVIQFVKPHPSFDEWRTVLWFTIDQPVPPSAPSALRYTSGNPNLLPWSYTLSPIPLLLRDASDTSMSKAYTIPANDAIPLPTLPITFPNLALYLQAALDTSRQHLSDSPNGLGKLAKMVQMCYPSANEGYSEYDDIPERTTVSHLFKRVIGRSNKDKKKGKGTNSNEDTYQLVTPFVPDEWG